MEKEQEKLTEKDELAAALGFNPEDLFSDEENEEAEQYDPEED